MVSVAGIRRVRRRQRTTISSLHDLNTRGPRRRRRSVQTRLVLQGRSPSWTDRPRHRDLPPRHRGLPRPRSPGVPVRRHQTRSHQDQSAERWQLCRVAGAEWTSGLAWRTKCRGHGAAERRLFSGTGALDCNTNNWWQQVAKTFQKNTLRLVLGLVDTSLNVTVSLDSNQLERCGRLWHCQFTGEPVMSTVALRTSNCLIPRRVAVADWGRWPGRGQRPQS